MSTQREKLKELIIEFCNKQESRTFTLKQLHSAYGNYEVIGIGGETPQGTVRRILQELARCDFINFVNKRGTYTLQGIELDIEKEILQSTLDENSDLNTREYKVEAFNRDTKLILKAKEVFGYDCFIDRCKNTFLTPKRKPYIEVHHIVPLFQKGEDCLENLSLLCAHHHKMAHFAEKDRTEELQERLLEINCKRM